MPTTMFFTNRQTGGAPIYCEPKENVRFCLARHGEDPTRVIEAFRKEYAGKCEGKFVLVPVFTYDLPPRKELCTKTSVTIGYMTYLAGPPNPDSDAQWKCLLGLFGLSMNALLPVEQPTIN